MENWPFITSSKRVTFQSHPDLVMIDLKIVWSLLRRRCLLLSPDLLWIHSLRMNNIENESNTLCTDLVKAATGYNVNRIFFAKVKFTKVKVFNRPHLATIYIVMILKSFHSNIAFIYLMLC